MGGDGSLISCAVRSSSSPCDSCDCAGEDGDGGCSVSSLVVEPMDDSTLEDETARLAGGGVWVVSVAGGDGVGGVDCAGCCACVVGGLVGGCFTIGNRGVC